MKGAGFSLKKHSKEENEDAFFISAKGAGVADGVGSWHQYGLSSCSFAQELMRGCEREVARLSSSEREVSASNSE